MTDSNPARQLVLVFLGVILLGTVLLALPASSATDEAIPVVDALFTSTSAVCVTGLIVRDTPHAFSTFGILVILGLIQVGGVGIMTFGVLFAHFLGADFKLGLRGQRSLQEDTGYGDLGSLAELLQQIGFWVVFVELLGAALLLPVFLSSGHGPPGPLGPVGDAVFFSVSAFCNAGFALRSDSLVRWADNAYLNAVIMLLIVLGGLGFGVLREVSMVVATRLRQRLHQEFDPRYLRFTTHARVVFVTTALLVVSGALLFLLAEGPATLARPPGQGGPSGPLGSFLRATFLSVTARTAGFNTVPIEEMAPAGLWFLILLMAIGASPGGTGGGIKTTTIAVLYSALRREARGDTQASLFGRAVPEAQIRRALGLSFSFLVLWGTGGFVLMLLEAAPLDTVLFEVVSALGTVGLSMGLTPELSGAGKLVVSFLMLTGRVGPMTLVLGLQVSRQKGTLKLPEAKELMIG